MESDYDGDGNSNSSCRTARKTTAKHSQNTSAPSFIHASTHSPLRTPSFRHIHPRTHSTVRNLLLGITNPVRPLRSPPSPSPSPSAFIPTQKISSPDPSPSSFGKKDPPSGVTANVPPHLASHRIAVAVAVASHGDVPVPVDRPCHWYCQIRMHATDRGLCNLVSQVFYL